ncbi:MAG TPA: elongation factor 1-beta [Candidatus Poseidoniia archaeon]|jgi:elongation factor 1-beta|nr:elongation factor 1-beta [Candidatus Poseidoniia archaeon]|tara:strand:- start:4271 stop:4537 length:267 start_codon:yes stop_codon:yes gene_type:complete
MGEVALKYRIMPESPDSDIENIVSKISETIPDDATLGAHEVKPFAFGLNAIFVAILGIDRDGFATEVEVALNGLPEVQSVEIEEMSLI